MTLTQELEIYLRDEPRARERSNKDIVFVNLLRYKLGLIDIDKKKLVDLVKLSRTLDRCWRKLLEENPAYRGNDYNQKDILEQKKELELGYEVGYHQDKKLLDRI